MIKQLLIAFSLVLLAVSCKQTPELKREPKEVIEKDGVRLEVYDFDHFKPFLSQEDDRIHVINFWATWCIPCVEELPYFEELTAAYPDIDVTLVSLDFPGMIESNLIPFIKENELKSDVIMLDEPNGNKWIPQIDLDWSGAIPATIIYRGEKRAFYEQSFNFEELEQAVQVFE